jgi:hypothetical protein
MNALPPLRAAERFRLTVSVVAKHPRSMRRIEAELWDLSIGGCRIVSTELLSVGDQLIVKIEGLENWPAAVVWTGKDSCGVHFHTPLHYAVAEHYARAFPCSISAMDSGTRETDGA